MKKLLVFLFMLSMMTFSSVYSYGEFNRPEVFTSGEWLYTVQEDETVEIHRYKGKSAYVTIPEELDGKTVSSIGIGAFSLAVNMMIVNIPDSITHIDANPFICPDNNLETIYVSDTHPYLGVINGVLFSKPDKRLISCSSGLKLESYSVPEGVKIIGTLAFQDCSTLKEVELPSSVTSIENSAFQGCSSLKKVNLPEGITSMGDYVFKSCSSLENVTLPTSLTSIGRSAFDECYSLKMLTIPRNVTRIDGVLSPLNPILVNVDKYSYAAQYCKELGYPYVDWLLE